MKKITSLVLTIMMLAAMMTMFALPAMAAQEETEKPEDAQWLVNDGDNCVWWEITGDDFRRTITVGGTGPMPDYGGAYGQPWADIDNITTVIIRFGVTSIGNYAFGYCEQIENVTIPAGLKSIGESAFSSCINIKNITIPESVEHIGSGAFDSCEQIEKVTIPGNVKDIGNSAFHHTGITELTISDGVKSIGQSAFAGCTSLREVIIPKGVESIGDYAFHFCSALKDVTIPESVKSIGSGVFLDCSEGFVIHGQYGSVAEEYAGDNRLAFEGSGTCSHARIVVCSTCQKSVSKNELLSAWGINTATGSMISEGSLTIIVGVACLAVGALGMYLIMKKKKPVLAGDTESDKE